MPEIFLCSTKEVSVHNLGCPVVSRVTLFLRFFRRPSAVSAPFWMTSYVICVTAIVHLVVFALVVKPISRDYVVVFIIVYGF